MNLFTRVFQSSLGKKYVMAVSGLALFFFVIGHLLGNLQVFLGPEAINAYGHFLQTKPELLWGARIGLLIMVLLHIWTAIRLSAENKAARPVAYKVYRPVGSSYASRTMLMSGVIIAAFIVYHLLHYTALVQAVNLTHQDFSFFKDEKGRHDVFRMMVTGFSNPVVVLFYVIAIALLCLHLSHGISAMFQSLGWRKKSYLPLLNGAAKGLSILLFLGYCSIPIAILMGFGRK